MGSGGAESSAAGRVSCALAGDSICAYSGARNDEFHEDGDTPPAQFRGQEAKDDEPMGGVPGFACNPLVPVLTGDSARSPSSGFCSTQGQDVGQLEMVLGLPDRYED